MDAGLKNLMTLDGVEGSMVLLRTGEVLTRKGLDQYMAELPEVTKRFLRIISAYKNLKSPIREIEVVWQNKRIIGVADDALIILAICRNGASFPLVRMTLNVTLAEFRNNKKSQKVLKKTREIKVNHLRIGDLDQSEINLISKLQ